MDGEGVETLTQARSLRFFSLTLRGKSEGVGRRVGNKRTKRLRAHTHTHTRPDPKPPAASEAVRSQRGGERSCQRRMRLQASRWPCSRPPKSQPIRGQAGRPPLAPVRRLGWDLRPRGWGSELLGSPAATLSPVGRALAGAAATRARTGPSCSPAAGSSALGPRGLAGPGLQPYGSRLFENKSWETGDTEPRKWQVMWAYWVWGVLPSDFKLQWNSSHQHIKEDAISPRPSMQRDLRRG